MPYKRDLVILNKVVMNYLPITYFTTEWQADMLTIKPCHSPKYPPFLLAYEVFAGWRKEKKTEKENKWKQKNRKKKKSVNWRQGNEKCEERKCQKLFAFIRHGLLGIFCHFMLKGDWTFCL